MLRSIAHRRNKLTRAPAALNVLVSYTVQREPFSVTTVR